MVRKTADGRLVGTKMQTGLWIDSEGNLKADIAEIAAPSVKIPAGAMSGFDNPLKPLNVPNRSAKDLQTGLKQFDFATKGDILDTATVLAKNRGAQLRTGGGAAEDKFNMQYNPDDPNSFGYETRFLFMKDPVNHYTEYPGFVTEEDGVAYEKRSLANERTKDIDIYPKRKIPVKDFSDTITTPNAEEVNLGISEDLSSSQKQPTTPKDKYSLGDDAMQQLKNWDNEMDRQIKQKIDKSGMDPSIMNKDVTDPALRGPKKVF